jgi:hypothetical protein
LEPKESKQQIEGQKKILMNKNFPQVGRQTSGNHKKQGI